MLRPIVLLVALVLTSLAPATLVAASPQNDGGSGCDAPESAAGAVPIVPGTYSGTLLDDFEDFSDSADFYRITVPPGPHVLTVTVTAPGYFGVEAQIIDPTGSWRGSAWSDEYDGFVVAAPAGEWFLGLTILPVFGTNDACDPGTGNEVDYTFTVAIEPRDHLAIFNRGTASLHTLDVTLPAGSGATLELHEDWRGAADWEAFWVAAHLPDGTSCGWSGFDRRGTPSPVALSLAGETLLGPGLSGFLHGVYGATNDGEARRLQWAHAVAGTIRRTIYAAWNGPEDALAISFPAGVIGDRGAHDFDSAATTTVQGGVAILGGSLDLDLAGPTTMYAVDPGTADPAFSTPLTLTRPGRDPLAITQPTTFTGAEAPAGLWHLEAERYVGVGGPHVRAIGLPFATPAVSCH